MRRQNNRLRTESRRLFVPPICSLLALTVLAGCRSTATQTQMLVPGTNGRADTIVALEPGWAQRAVRALRDSPGCLGVEASQLSGNRAAIFAMFRDKASAVTWYRGEVHQSLVDKVRFYRDHEHGPLSGVADGTGPILAIATLSRRAAADGDTPPYVLLSVELFTPLEGGVSFGGASFLPK